SVFVVFRWQTMVSVFLSASDQQASEVPITGDMTCKDVVEACRPLGDTACHLVEAWHGHESVVPDNERMLEVLQRWGSKQHEVRFFLQRAADTTTTGPGGSRSQNGTARRNGMSNVANDRRQENGAGSPGVELTLEELQEMATRQQQQIEAQQQLLVAKEQRLLYLKQQEARQKQQQQQHSAGGTGIDGEKLRALREKIESQEAKLRKIRAAKGQADNARHTNKNLAAEMEQVNALFLEKQQELAVASHKVEKLTRQLDEGAVAVAQAGHVPSPAAVELERLSRELQMRNKLNQEQNSRLQQQKDLLNKRNQEVVMMDRRISELRERLRSKKAAAQQKENIPVRRRSPPSTRRVALVDSAVGSRCPRRTCRVRIESAPTDVDFLNINFTAQVNVGDTIQPRHASAAGGRVAAVGPIVQSQAAAAAAQHRGPAVPAKPNGAVKSTAPHGGGGTLADGPVKPSSLLVETSSPLRHAAAAAPEVSSPLGIAMAQAINGKCARASWVCCNNSGLGWCCFFPGMGYYIKADFYIINTCIELCVEELVADQSLNCGGGNECCMPSMLISLFYASTAVSSFFLWQIRSTYIFPKILLRTKHKRQVLSDFLQQHCTRSKILLPYFGEILCLLSNTAASEKKDVTEQVNTDHTLIIDTPLTHRACTNHTPCTYRSLSVLTPQRVSFCSNTFRKAVAILSFGGGSRACRGEKRCRTRNEVAWINCERCCGCVTEVDIVETSETSFCLMSALGVLLLTKVKENVLSLQPTVNGRTNPISPDSDNPKMPSCQYSGKQTLDSPCATAGPGSDGMDADRRGGDGARPGLRESTGAAGAAVGRQRSSVGTQAKELRFSWTPVSLWEPSRAVTKSAAPTESAPPCDCSRVRAKVRDASQPNDEGITALHNAVCAGHMEIVRLLVHTGVNVNAADSDGWTPLHCAASCNNVHLCKFLVESGAAVFAVTISDSETAADKCEEMEEGYQQCSQFLYGVQEKLGLMNKCVVFALWDYEATRDDELAVREGDSLSVLRRSGGAETEWWWARLGEREGFVPRNLLGLYPRIKPKSRSLA
uniref:Protein phosphatase 1, regulatory subunit 13Bb n=1 Tax=Petromyzon marinus TaxID=7757 RepID=S4RGC3_PETMA